MVRSSISTLSTLCDLLRSRPCDAASPMESLRSSISASRCSSRARSGPLPGEESVLKDHELGPDLFISAKLLWHFEALHQRSQPGIAPPHLSDSRSLVHTRTRGGFTGNPAVGSSDFLPCPCKPATKRLMPTGCGMLWRFERSPHVSSAQNLKHTGTPQLALGATLRIFRLSHPQCWVETAPVQRSVFCASSPHLILSPIRSSNGNLRTRPRRTSSPVPRPSTWNVLRIQGQMRRTDRAPGALNKRSPGTKGPGCGNNVAEELQMNVLRTPL